MKIINFRPKQKDNSIYSMLKSCTNGSKLDDNKFDELINPTVEGELKISSGFLDQFGINDKDRSEQVPKILEVILKIYNDEILFKDIENELKNINFKTLNIIDEVLKKLNNDNYNVHTYETFKKLMYETSDKEVFKFSVEMTGVIGLCEELIDDYVLIGQSEEFSKYISFILCVWRDNPKFLDGLFHLLDNSSNWGSINYAEMLMDKEDIMSDIKNQRRILIGALKNNCIPMEIGYYLASSLNIEELCKISHGDRNLSEAFVDLYYTLFFEREPSGGILDLDDPLKYINSYLKCVKYSKFKDINFVGMKNIYRFISDKNNSNEFIEKYNKETFDLIKNEVEALWENINTVNNLKEVINEGTDYIYDLAYYVRENKIKEVIPELEKIYKEKEKEHPYLEQLLSELGSDSIKKYIYKELKKEYKNRLKGDKKYSYINLFGDEYKLVQKIQYKIDILAWEGTKDYDLIGKMLEDYNPEIRCKALKVINKAIYYTDDKSIMDKVKERLCDGPLYVRNEALKLCKNINFKITPEEKDYILEKIKEREGESINGEDSFTNNINDILYF